MGFILTLVFIILVYLSPGDTFPALAPFRPVLVLIIVGSIGAALALVSNQQKWWVPQIPLLLAFTGIVLTSLPLRGWFGGIIVAATIFLPSVVAFFLVLSNVQSTTRLRWLAAAYIAVGIYFSIRGMLAYHYGYDAERFATQGARVTLDPGTGMAVRTFFLRTRALGILGDPNDLSQNFLLCLAFLGMAWKKGNPFRNLLFIGLPGLVILYSIYLTGSRGAIIGLFVLTAVALRRKLGLAGPVLGAGFTAVLVLAIGFGGGRMISASGEGSSGRLDIWSDTITLLRSNPLLGVGFNGITEYTHHTTHNSFLLCAAELGLPAYFLYLGIIVVTVMQLRQVREVAGRSPATEDLRQVAHCTLLALYTFLATSWFLSRTYIITPFILFGMGASTYLVAKNAGLLDHEPALSNWIKVTLGLLVGSLAVIYVLVRIRWLTGA
jgi:hypothetical protein